MICIKHLLGFFAGFEALGVDDFDVSILERGSTESSARN